MRPERRVRVLPDAGVSKLAPVTEIVVMACVVLTNCLPSIVRYSQVCRVECILTLVVIDETSIYHVNNVDDGLCDEHALQEVVWAPHLGPGIVVSIRCLPERVQGGHSHKFDEQLQTSVG
jgi:hypothetical protein